MRAIAKGVRFGSWVEIRSDKLEAETISGIVVAVTGETGNAPCSIVRKVNERSGPLTLSTLVGRINPATVVYDPAAANQTGILITRWLRHPGAHPAKNKTWWSEVAHRLADLDPTTQDKEPDE